VNGISLRRLRYWVRRKVVKKGNLVRSIAITFVVAFLQILLLIKFPAGGFETNLLDAWFGLRGEIPPPREIVILAGDEESAGRLGLVDMTNWRRERLAALIEEAAACQAKLLLLDYIIKEETNQEGDKALARALAKIPSVIGFYHQKVKRAGSHGQVLNKIERLEPPDMFAKAATRSASLGIMPDSDTVRRFAPGSSQGGEAGSLAESVLGEKLTRSNLPGQYDFINYYGKAGAIPTFSFYQILQQKDPEICSFLKDKIVFIGNELLGPPGLQVRDRFNTPFRSPTFGIEIHATAGANILSGDWIRRLRPFYELLLMFVVAGSMSYLILSLNPGKGLGVLIGFGFFWASFSYVMFRNGYFIPGIFLVFLFLPGAWLVSSLSYYFLLRKIEAGIGVKLDAGR
jgi:adenylate cyclase